MDNSKKIRIFDTTLRDGEQAPGCSMNLQEKLEVARQLERLKVDVIEAGFAISSPGDFESVSEVARIIRDCTVGSLARALPKDIDAAFEAVRHAQSPLIHVFLSTSPLHMEYKLRMSPDKVLERAGEMVKYARSRCPNVEFSAEDATRSDWDFLARVVESAISNGASTINLPDTVGYTVPGKMAELIAYMREKVPNADQAVFSVHCHNDLGMAVANSISAIAAGAGQIECAVNGLGERAGNASLEEIVMALKTRKDHYRADCRVDTTQLYRTSRLVYGIIGMNPPMNKPIVGANAFAHESGIHQHGVMANKETYEIMTPESVGLTQNKMVLGKHSGRHAFEARARDLGYVLTDDEIKGFFEDFKRMCDLKKTVTDSDIEAIISSKIAAGQGLYRLARFDLQSGNKVKSTCAVQLEKEGSILEDVALGDGPVNAAFNAVDKLTGPQNRKLLEYAIHSISQGEDALGEVAVKVQEGKRRVTGRGLSVDIMEASILAYINAINKLAEMGERYDEEVSPEFGNP